MDVTTRKNRGAFYTPNEVVQSLVRWAARHESDRLLDPSCGDGRFLAVHRNSVGVEQDPQASAKVHQRVPGSLIHEGDFFRWAGRTHERFECAAGNPPFIRYQRFSGEIRKAAQALCEQHGVKFSSLSSSWAPFLVATATLLKRGGRMAFVVPAEIGHAPYAVPVLQYAARNFEIVHVIAIRQKLFPDLSEDCWLLFCDGFGGSTQRIHLTSLDRFTPSSVPPNETTAITLLEWETWNHRLRPFLLRSDVREMYRDALISGRACRMSEVAQVSIGYVTGANDFFHMRPSEAKSRRIDSRFLIPAVRNGKYLSGKAITNATVQAWLRRDESTLLLRLQRGEKVPSAIAKYLDSPAGRQARTAYKCRVRDPWYSVPDVTQPHGFLSYMSGEGPSLVANHARCAATNSVHVVNVHEKGITFRELQRLWNQDFTKLSCELEGHPLGGGMLKVEPGEAARVVLQRSPTAKSDIDLIQNGIQMLRRWRHYG